MSSEKPNTVIVNILDKDYQVGCPPEQQAELAQSAQHLDSQMRKIREAGKVIGLDRIAVMAALNIAHELMQEKSRTGSDADTEDKLKRIDSKLDNALQDYLQIEI